MARVLSRPFTIRVPFFLIFGLIRGPENKKGKRVLPRNLVGGASGFGALLGGSWDLVSKVISRL